MDFEGAVEAGDEQIDGNVQNQSTSRRSHHHDIVLITRAVQETDFGAWQKANNSMSISQIPHMECRTDLRFRTQSSSSSDDRNGATSKEGNEGRATQ